MWWNILKVRAMNKRSKQLVEEVIDETPRSTNEILDLMYDKVEEKRKTKSGPNKRPGSGRNLIPTRRELQRYLSKNYNKIRVSKITGKEVSGTTNSESRYFR